MAVYTAAGGWPGTAEGRIVWVGAPERPERAQCADRPAEIGRLREALARGLADLETWIERQPTLGGRVVLQQCREALQDAAFTQRVTMLIDQHGLAAPAALEEAAALVAGVMARSEELAERAQALQMVARWLARRLEGTAYPDDAILVAPEFSPLEVLDRTRPAVMAAGEPPVVGDAPLLWGVAAVSPEWEGRRARVDGLLLSVAEEAEPALPYEAERRKVIVIARRMQADGLVRLTSGNVSCRIPGTDLLAITPSGMPYDRLEPADICVLDLDGNVVDARRRPSTETPLHRLTYRRRPDVGGIVHTHSLYASAFACVGRELPVISTELAGLVGSAVRCAPYAPSGTEEFAQTAVETLGDEDVAVLFQNHGVMAVGPTLDRAYAVAVGVEEAAQLYCIASHLGEPIILPEEERRRLFRYMQTRYGQPGGA
ncbi:MAG: class II aldolase/adducin family protein [Symbiobacterium sp.]|uniref:class II aldolase/adducin family protein n=1 Tax=Symbiobacterium sp. TaxID=1971213 RepID=UPI00346473E8